MTPSRIAPALAVAVCLALPPGADAVAGAASAPTPAAAADALIEREIPSLLTLYRTLHAAPELSHHEERTSSSVAAALREAGFSVTERVGRYARADLTGWGVVGILKNGEGPTLLVRTELDALPLSEKTGLPYASTARAMGESGQEVGVMHACGHDLHMTSFIGSASVLAAMKASWRGTLMFVGQPAEETIDGARAMLADGLYERFGRPDYAFSLHDDATLEAGKIGWCPGFALAASTSVDLLVRGVSSHGSRPEGGKDPIVIASEIVLALQTIVSREKSPFDPAVVTVGSIHGGAKRNIIPDEVALQLTVRTYKDDVRAAILASIGRIARGAALAAGVPEDRMPVMRVLEDESAPATWNDPALAERLARAIARGLGDRNVVRMDPVMGSEDFGRFALEGHPIPAVQLQLGAVDPQRAEDARRSGAALPSLHSSQFAPLPEPAIRTGVKATVLAALDLMGGRP